MLPLLEGGQTHLHFMTIEAAWCGFSREVLESFTKGCVKDKPSLVSLI